MALRRKTPPTNSGEVVETTRLSPTMMRVVLGGGTLDAFEPSSFTDSYVNALFLPDGAPYEVPFSRDEVAELDSELRPKPRRYTVRSWDGEKQQLTIDFVAHGDVGYAGRWAQHCGPGDRLQFNGPGGGYRPDPDADWYLMVGDESALPAIAASMEQVSEGTPCVVLAVVDSPDHELPLPTSSSIRVRWLHRSESADPADLLLGAVTALEFPSGTPDVFVHGEAGEVRGVRRHLKADRGIDVDAASISPYWRRDHTDEAWREIKSQWMADVRQDA
ncbi:MAG: siderophore-interacting protein [Actinomycetota bacterium]